jgi:UDP-glucose 4-epimerase
MHDKRIVVTGGAGFIGSNIAWSLCEDNEVVVIDNLATGNIVNIKKLVTEKKIEFVRGSVTDLKLMKKALKGADYVLHQAAIPSVPRSVRDPLATNEAGVTGTLATLVASRDSGVKKVVFASSSSVYGDTPTLPKHEGMPPSPLSPYAVTKTTAESYCKLFTDLYGLGTVSLRYFNVYGPRQDSASEYAAVIPKFIKSALKGKPLVVYGDGTQTRDFTYILDAVQANVLAAQSKAGGNYNIAAGRRITVNELAATIIEITGSRARVKHEKPRPGDIKHSLADISHARVAFGYSPEYSLKQGLLKTVDWFSKGKQGV